MDVVLLRPHETPAQGDEPLHVPHGDPEAVGSLPRRQEHHTDNVALATLSVKQVVPTRCVIQSDGGTSGQRFLSVPAATMPGRPSPDGYERSTVDDAISTPVKQLCPRCGAREAVPLVMGLPSAELFELADRGLVVLGGCLMGPEEHDVHCRSCGHEWSADEVLTEQ